jgi:hypothetical protein
MLYGTVIWLLAGLFQAQWWVQFACFILSVLLVMRINSKNLLIRIYSRSVSVAFIFLSCAAVFLFPSWTGGLVQLCCIAALMLLFDSYQDQMAVGKAYYAFLLLGISSMLDANIIFYLPLLWIMMKIIVYALSWRTFFASLLGLATPYWFMIGWLMWQKNGDLQAIVSLFAVQDILQFPFGFSSTPLSYQLIMAFSTLLMIIGSMIHHARTLLIGASGLAATQRSGPAHAHPCRQPADRPLLGTHKLPYLQHHLHHHNCGHNRPHSL